MNNSTRVFIHEYILYEDIEYYLKLNLNKYFDDPGDVVIQSDFPKTKLVYSRLEVDEFIEDVKKRVKYVLKGEKVVKVEDMTKDKINEIIDMVQAIAKVAIIEIENSDLIDDDKKKKIAVIEPAVSNIIDQLQIILNEVV
jgi:cell division septum initiation protein DivIVA